jgi:hypothetical protein
MAFCLSRDDTHSSKLPNRATHLLPGRLLTGLNDVQCLLWEAVSDLFLERNVLVSS